MLKRCFDILAALFGLIVFSPLILICMFLVWKQDGYSPFYMAPRVGKGEKMFTMVKLRSMVMNADKSGVDSTGANDKRITGVGRFVRRFKVDELTQLWNVLIGDMSLVGPRPNVQRDTDLYTHEEKRLLSAQPGITDFSSIVFSDEGDILKDSVDPDIDYNQLIRPWKSQLGLFYIDHQSLWLDIQLVFITAIAIVSRSKALALVHGILKGCGASPELLAVALREMPLKPTPPPGSSEIVIQR